MEPALNTIPRTVGRSEQALVAAARRGDDRAFEELYAQYRDRVSAFIFGKVRDYGRAEDISQEVFISALRQLRASEQSIAFKPWIFAIAKNACIDEFRRGARSREVSVESDEELPSGGGAMLSAVPTPPSVIEGKQRLADLRGAFGGLSESQHRLLVMREFEGRSYDEIGDRLGMTRQMVESGLFRARRKLSEEYDELASGRRCEQVQTVLEAGSSRPLTRLGVRERRRLTRHLSHCQGCRHQARMAGIDETLFEPRSIAAKIAAFLPFGGLWRWPWRGGGGAGRHLGSSHAASAVQGATQAAGPGGSFTLGQAAAAAAALALAGAGGGVLIDSAHHHAANRAAIATHNGARTSAKHGAGGHPAHAVTAAARYSTASGAASHRVSGYAAKTAAGAIAASTGNISKHPARQTQGQTASPPAPSGSTTTPAGTAQPAGGSTLGTGKVTTTAKTTTKNLVSSTLQTAGQTLSKTTGAVKSTTGSMLNSPVVKKTAGAVGSVLDSLLPTSSSSGSSGSTGSSPSGTTGSTTPSSSNPVVGVLKSTVSKVVSGS